MFLISRSNQPKYFLIDHLVHIDWDIYMHFHKKHRYCRNPKFSCARSFSHSYVLRYPSTVAHRDHIASAPSSSPLCLCHRTVQIIPIKCTYQPFKFNPPLLHSTSTPRLPAITRIDYTGTLAKRRTQLITNNKSFQT